MRVGASKRVVRPEDDSVLGIAMFGRFRPIEGPGFDRTIAKADGELVVHDRVAMAYPSGNPGVRDEPGRATLCRSWRCDWSATTRTSTPARWRATNAPAIALLVKE